MQPLPPEGVAATDPFAPPSVTFSSAKVHRVVTYLTSRTHAEAQNRWLEAVAARVCESRPDLQEPLLRVLDTSPGEEDILAGLSIGEIGVCYEALLAQLDRNKRQDSGQFFTPDDTANFMALRTESFPDGVWLDPCCGVGNLAWHLAAIQSSPGDFVRDRLILIDQDETALRTAVALISAEFATPNDAQAVHDLHARARYRDFLSREKLPDHDFAILNPPYAKAPERRGYETGQTRDLFAYFMERVATTSRGFVSVTPASYISAPKFQSLRDVIERETQGGNVFVFDNVPDTLFRGYKYGSNNTSKTNFVRAAITVCSPNMESWQTTPIIRWQAAARKTMFAECTSLLTPRKIGPHGEWAKLSPQVSAVWEALIGSPECLSDLTVQHETPFALEVALTPRYFISATYKPLNRGSKAILYFEAAEDRDRAAIVLNSSIPYLWWRALDGGVTLPRRVLHSVPIPKISGIDASIVERIRHSEEVNTVTKLNAGRRNENVKHPPELVDELNRMVIPDGVAYDFDILYSNSMFPLALVGSGASTPDDKGL